MRPKLQTGAHQTQDLAELVCSNSLGSNLTDRASGLLKNEARALGSMLLEAAAAAALPAGGALAVDRQLFARLVTERIQGHRNIELVREEVKKIPQTSTIVAIGPLEPREIPFEAPTRQLSHDLEVAGTIVPVTVVSMGNPHAVQVVDDGEQAPLARDRPLIGHHRRFPRRVNAGFMQVLDRRAIRLRVWERGAGETLACGSGACASVVASILRGVADERVRVELRGGDLDIHWAGGTASVLMAGPAATVFTGTIELEGS